MILKNSSYASSEQVTNFSILSDPGAYDFVIKFGPSPPYFSIGKSKDLKLQNQAY